ncbi:chlorohydrolase family protein [Kribbella sp. NPDC059898]|uniref:chlorohydrolase family protein n=1 Tax=Kribbella sp. NPDC059898 TaxID=3346995 RepID=UPI00365C0A44
MITRLSARFILAHRNGRHMLLRDAHVVYEGDRITYVGTGDPGPADELIDAGDALVMPGLIDLDALCDVDHLQLDSWASPGNATGLQWSEDYFRHRRHDVFTADERAAVREYALVQLALHGVTTYMPIAAETHSGWAETCDDFVAVAEAGRRIGLRGYLGPSFRSGVNVVREDGSRTVLFDEEQGERGLRQANAFLDWAEAQHDPLINGVLLPCRVETLTPDLLRAVAELSARRGALVRIHALQGLVERQVIGELYGCTPLELLDRCGLIGPRTLIPHGIYIDRRVLGADHGDLARLADAGVSIIHCPLTSFRYGSALRSLPAYVEAGVNVALGTDSFPPDLIRGMDTGVHLAKLLEGRADAAPAERYVEAATLGGAKALGRADLGRIEVGAQADLVAFALDDLRDGAVDDPVRTLLLSGTARQLRHSVVAGRTVVRDGELSGVDTAAVRRRGQELFGKLKAAYSERDHRRRTADELFPPTFPAAD